MLVLLTIWNEESLWFWLNLALNPNPRNHLSSIPLPIPNIASLSLDNQQPPRQQKTDLLPLPHHQPISSQHIPEPPILLHLMILPYVICNLFVIGESSLQKIRFPFFELANSILYYFTFYTADSTRAFLWAGRQTQTSESWYLLKITAGLDFFSNFKMCLKY